MISLIKLGWYQEVLHIQPLFCNWPTKHNHSKAPPYHLEIQKHWIEGRGALHFVLSGELQAYTESYPEF